MVFQFFQKLGKSFMLPIAVLPAAGIILAIGREDVFNIPFIYEAGNAIFANLALIFAMGVAIGISKDGNGAAALSGAISYFILSAGTTSINSTNNMGVLGGILCGLLAGYVYNKFKDTKLPEYLGFFSGRRLVPIMTALFTILLAAVFGYVWPPIQSVINDLGEWILSLGATGAGLFGFFNRLLIPLGLHHVLNNLFWFQFGEFSGATGDLARFFKGDPSAGVFMTGFFPVMMFGLPAACLAMVVTAKPEKRKATAGLMIGMALTSFITGITEPIEFSFMFLSPLLYGVHAILTGLSLFIVNTLGIHSGFAFSAGAIDYVLSFGIAQKPILLLAVGIIYGVVYFVVFYFLIKLLKLKTPGREDDDMEDIAADDAVTTGGASMLVEGLGGKDNITTIDHCATRLRLTVEDTNLLNEGTLKKAGAKGVLTSGKTSVQIIIGTNVEFVADDLRKEVDRD
ncbi:N-acetylglucosamine-specific PTS transporter subunit IIBC [Bacillus safensis]|nr:MULTISPECIES: N-acetylglucosamine-specific PTS transporter subunit IIBC [Bacillus]MBW4850575.1 N-acetylglucosamine-specific PTS transporter subunit IIBC [Bacillaceae bacterium]KMK71733.1 PTS sugar transporter [Bacillus safensis]MBU5206482.1 N-acetylglucosamine-specific PTS transporter subunit IIBC [Bacillus safensis]MBW4852871.1 N-acetylglucosamine-specific PTS transporter subunit IIBC [Bacillaceae bacterium]MBW4855089.1 N-acetylglucosamine-specific PTS transporter subunit IIBC [Bacillaceae